MKKNIVTLSFVIVLCVSIVALQPTASCAPAKDGDQEKSKEKKVLTTTTDEKGFQKELTEVDMIYQTAKQFMSANQWEKAVEELQRVVSAERDRIEAWRDMADCYDKLEAPGKAAEAYRQAVSVRPDDLVLLSLLGYAELRAQEAENAFGTYTKMLELDTLNYDASVHLGFILHKQGNLPKAIEHYKRALRSNPQDVPTMGSLAKIYTELGELDKAMEMYELAVQNAGEEQKANLLSKLGAAYISAKQFDKSAVVFEELVVKNPERPSNHYNLGISYMQLKKYNEAIPSLKKVIELKPDFVAAYQQLGASYNEIKQYERAIETIKSGLDYADNKSALYVTWAASLEKLKMFDDAIGLLQQVVNDPQYGDYAKKQIERQKKLKIREEKIREQQ